MRVVIGILCAAMLPCFGATIVHEDPGSSFTTNRAAVDAPVGRLTVSGTQIISGLGVDVSLSTDTNLEFLIFDSSTGALLYQSAPKAFLAAGSGYKFSDPFTFTFSPGTTYGLTAIADTSGTYGYFVDTVPNTVGVFSFLTGNQNITGTFGSPTLDTNQFCCDVGTAIVTDAVPEPRSAVLIAVGLLVVWLRRRA
jgi:hypothetical protein